MGTTRYKRDMMIMPPTMFPNKRKDSDMGVAISLMTLRGKRKAIGSKKPLKYPTIPFDRRAVP